MLSADKDRMFLMTLMTNARKGLARTLGLAGATFMAACMAASFYNFTNWF